MRQRPEDGREAASGEPDRPRPVANVFVARQPILDGDLVVRGYELLFRSGLENAFDHSDPDRASSRVISDLLYVPGVDVFSAQCPGFINITRELLLREAVKRLPAVATVVEITETITPDAAVIQACRNLRGHGFRIALDDFRLGRGRDGMLEVADIVKVDVLATSPDERAHLARQLLPRGIILLAEKVETQEMYLDARRLGYSLFQGHFFARPKILAGRDIPASKLNHLRVLREIHRPELDFEAIAVIVEHDVGLSYKLMRYANSCYFGVWGSVHSLRHALVLIGEVEIRRWASVIALAGMATDKPEELLNQALVRARLSEVVAPDAGLAFRGADFFLMGLFSLIDAILDRPLSEILPRLPLAEDIRDALLGQKNLPREVLDLVVAYTDADWETVTDLSRRLRIVESVLPARYAETIEWCQGSVDLGHSAKAA